MQAERPRELAGKRALITGASRGIGLAIARRLAQDGARVVLTAGHSREPLDSAVEQLRAEGAEAHAIMADLGDSTAIDAMFKSVRSLVGGVDVLVNNAAQSRDGLTMLLPPAAWREVLAVNLDGAFQCSRAALRTMIGARHGRIVNIVSPAAFLGKAGAAAYSAAKGGLLAFTKSLAAEVGRHGITVNAVCPGFVGTDLIAGMPDGERDAILSRIPLGRFGEAVEIAEGVVFLASDRARYITGTTLVIDGGLTML